MPAGEITFTCNLQAPLHPSVRQMQSMTTLKHAKICQMPDCLCPMEFPSQVKQIDNHNMQMRILSRQSGFIAFKIEQFCVGRGCVFRKTVDWMSPVFLTRQARLVGFNRLTSSLIQTSQNPRRFSPTWSSLARGNLASSSFS